MVKGILVIKGGPGSGHFGHVGRPGKRGGSLPGAGVAGGNRQAIGVPGDLGAIIAEGMELAGYEWQDVADARAEYAKLVDAYNGDEQGTLYAKAEDRAKWRNERLNGTESYEESLAMSVRREIDTISGWGATAELANEAALMEKFGISQDEAKAYIRDMNIDSWNKPKSGIYQNIAHSLSNNENLPEDFMSNFLANADKPTSTDRAVFNHIYERTQNMFREAGITEVTLYRGLQLPVNKYSSMRESANGIVNFRQGPLSSWSFDPYIGTCFGNCTVSMKVPVERIWSTGLTGTGTIGEFEAVVFEGIGDDEVSYKWTR